MSKEDWHDDEYDDQLDDEESDIMTEKQYRDMFVLYRRHFSLNSNWVSTLIGLVLGILAIRADADWLFVIGIILLAYTIFRWGMRTGHKQGFVTGYEIGRNAGYEKGLLDQALGVNDEARQNI